MEALSPTNVKESPILGSIEVLVSTKFVGQEAVRDPEFKWDVTAEDLEKIFKENPKTPEGAYNAVVEWMSDPNLDEAPVKTLRVLAHHVEEIYGAAQKVGGVLSSLPPSCRARGGRRSLPGFRRLPRSRPCS